MRAQANTSPNVGETSRKASSWPGIRSAGTAYGSSRQLIALNASLLLSV